MQKGRISFSCKAVLMLEKRTKMRTPKEMAAGWLEYLYPLEFNVFLKYCQHMIKVCDSLCSLYPLWLKKKWTRYAPKPNYSCPGFRINTCVLKGSRWTDLWGQTYNNHHILTRSQWQGPHTVHNSCFCGFWPYLPWKLVWIHLNLVKYRFAVCV